MIGCEGKAGGEGRWDGAQGAQRGDDTAGWCRGPHCCTFMCKTHLALNTVTCALPHYTRKGEGSKLRSGQSLRTVGWDPSAAVFLGLASSPGTWALIGGGGAGRERVVTGRRPPRPGETKRQGQRFRLRRGGQRPREVRRFPRTRSGGREGGVGAWLTAAASGRRARVVQLRGASGLQSASPASLRAPEGTGPGTRGGSRTQADRVRPHRGGQDRREPERGGD